MEPKRPHDPGAARRRDPPAPRLPPPAPRLGQGRDPARPVRRRRRPAARPVRRQPPGAGVGLRRGRPRPVRAGRLPDARRSSQSPVPVRQRAAPVAHRRVASTAPLTAEGANVPALFDSIGLLALVALGVLLCIFLVPYALGPVLIYFTMKVSGRPTLKEFYLEDPKVPRDTWEYVEDVLEEIERDGFAVLGAYFLGTLVPNVRSF